MANFIKRVLMFCVVFLGAATVESQTGNCSDCTVSTWEHDRPKLVVLDNGTLTTYSCTRPCSEEVTWCLKDDIGQLDLFRDVNYYTYVKGHDGSTAAMPGMEGNCPLTITILAFEEIDGDILYCASDCSQLLCSLTTPLVLHVRGPPSPSPTCPHPTDNTPGTITITTTVSSSMPISSQELATTLTTVTTKSSTQVVPSPSQSCITEYVKKVTCGTNRALPGVIVVAIGFLAAITIVHLL